MYVYSLSRVFASPLAAEAKHGLFCRNEFTSAGRTPSASSFICNIDLELFAAQCREKMTKCELIDPAERGAEVDVALY